MSGDDVVADDVTWEGLDGNISVEWIFAPGGRVFRYLPDGELEEVDAETFNRENRGRGSIDIEFIPEGGVI